MPTAPEAIAALIREVTAHRFRDDLLAKGQARSMRWRDGELPADAPVFSSLLSYDLLSYAYALMTQGLRLLDQVAEPEAARSAFENAASAIEAVIARARASNDRAFHLVIAGACYHLARYSARAFSLLNEGLHESNLSHPERALALLMLRDLDRLAALIAEDRLGGRASDDALVHMLSGTGEPLQAGEGLDEDAGGDERLFDVVDIALADHFMGAIGIAMLAFERGERELLETAVVAGT
jgi:hypothetical protein